MVAATADASDADAAVTVLAAVVLVGDVTGSIATGGIATGGIATGGIATGIDVGPCPRILSSLRPIGRPRTPWVLVCHRLGCDTRLVARDRRGVCSAHEPI
jgi:hypothetical protein